MKSTPPFRATPPVLLGYLLLSIGGSALTALLPLPRIVFVLTLCGIFALLVTSIAKPFEDALRAGDRDALLPLGLATGFFVYAAIRLGSSSFAIDDEIYSWNMWAVQHFRGEAIDTSYTRAAYPQLFPWFVSACYRAMDTVRVHAVPRLFASIPALIFFLSIIYSGRGRPRLGALVIAALFFGLSINRELSVGLADPLMAAALLTSAMFVVHYDRDPVAEESLMLALAAAAIACFTKQAALIWGCFTLPLLIVIGWRAGRYPNRALVLALIGGAICLVWPLFLAPHFTGNSGVINASMGNRGYLEQLLFAANRYLLHQPVLLALFVGSVFVIRRDAFLARIWWLGLLPMTIAWFLFGAYQIRLGIHVAGLAGLMIMVGFTAPSGPSHTPISPGRARALALSIAIAAMVIIAGGTMVAARIKGTDLRDGPRSTFLKQYGAEAGPMFDRLIAENARIWTTSNYAYGALYGVLPVGRPDYAIVSYDEERIRRDLLAFDAGYAIYGGSVAYGPQSQILKSLAEHCPAAFAPVLGPPNQFGFILYKVDRKALGESCLN